jgi:hypothetical protein
MAQEMERGVRRSRQYWYDDGLTEIAAGCILVATGLLFLAEAQGLILPGASSIGLMVVVAGGMFVARRAVGYAKARITYPRTGFVQYQRRPRRSRALAGGVAAFMGALVAALFATAPASLAWIPAVDGVLIGGFMLYLGHSLGLKRFYALAALSAAIGGAVSLSGAADILGSGIYFVATGLCVLASGGITLAAYLQRPSTPEAQ